MKKNNNNISDEILIKHLLGETSDSESASVNEWIDQSEHNKKYFDQLKLVWDESKKLTHLGTINEDKAWARFRQRTTQHKAPAHSVISLQWLKIAAALVLLAGLGYLLFLKTIHDPKQFLAKQTKNHPNKISVSQTDTVSKLAKEPVCNGTSCPIEICIVQTFKCRDVQLPEVTTCSTLSPDESGQLSYKAANSMGKNCALVVKEIRIKRIKTGETIILDEHSSPVTAQHLFTYITGQRKGNVVAGIFHTDCNNRSQDHGLQFDNKFGDLILQ